MTTAGQFSSDYTALPPVAVVERNHDSDENQFPSHHGAGDWGYHDRQMMDQGTTYPYQGHWQYTNGTFVGQSEPQGYLQHGYNTDPAAIHPTTLSYQGGATQVAVPPAAYYTPAGWVYYGNGTPYWPQQGALGDGTAVVNDAPLHQPQLYAGRACASQMRSDKDGVISHTVPTTAGIEQPAYVSADGWQHRAALIDPVAISEPHPRDTLPVWKWRTVLGAFFLSTMINGYDVSNIANIQPAVLRAFGQVELLPWLALSWSVANVAITPLARKLFKFYDIKILTIFAYVLYIVGAALAGASPTFTALIVGRLGMAIAVGIGYQGILTFIIIYSYPTDTSLVQASFGAFFAFGILTGPVIGAGFSQTEHATWRWSIYLVLPMMVVALGLLLIALPNYSVSSNKSVSKHFKEIDWVGHILHVSLFVLLALACVYSGGTWGWSTVPELAVWIVIGSLTLSYGLQQFFSLGVKPERRILPIHLLHNRVVLFTWLCTFGSAIAYGVTLYYTPLLYSFAREMNPLQVGLRLLCFTTAFIVSIFIAHSLLPVIKYYMPIFLAGAILLLVGAILSHTITPETATASIMGYDIIIGSGVGILWNLAIPVCSVILEDREDRLDMTTLHAVAQTGGTAISLSASALIYHNKGVSLLRDSIQFTGYTTEELLGLLSGAESDVLSGLPGDVRDKVMETIVKTIVQCFSLIFLAAALALVAALALKIEPLQFRRRLTREREDGSKGDLEKTPSLFSKRFPLRMKESIPELE